MLADLFKLKIFSLHSFQIDQPMGKGMRLHRINPHPATGEPLQASRSPNKEAGKYHSTLLSLRECLQIAYDTLQ